MCLVIKNNIIELEILIKITGKVLKITKTKAAITKKTIASSKMKMILRIIEKENNTIELEIKIKMSKNKNKIKMIRKLIQMRKIMKILIKIIRIQIQMLLKNSIIELEIVIKTIKTLQTIIKIIPKLI